MFINFKKLSTLVIVVLPLVASAQTEISLNGDWHFRYEASQVSADAFATEPNWQGADVVRVPSCWSILGYEEPVYRTFKDAPQGEGFYHKTFSVPQSFAGKRVSLNFGGVWASAEVWVNGTRLGRHDSGYTSFSMPVDAKLLNIGEGKSNDIVVRVRQVYPGYTTDTYDDWSLGGIYRDVTLSWKPAKCWIDKITAETDFDDDYRDADLRLGVMVYDNHKNDSPGNYRLIGPDYQLRYILKDADGSVVLDETKTVEGHPLNGRQYDESFHISKPKQWNAETPNLYTLEVQLKENGEVCQTERQKIGFREISTQGGIFRINGQAVKLRGVNRHDEWPDVGRATRPEHWLKDLQMMKETNINYIRACHYQHAKGFIEMCDSIGMYVGGEVCLGGAGQLMENPQFVPDMMLRTFETVNRDLNNPSIVYWSVGNEDTFNQMFYDAAKIVKTLDPTRPVLYPWCADLRLPTEIDIIAPHYWTSCEYDSLCAASSRPIITTEYVHAFGTQRFGGLEQCFKALHDSPHGAGGAVWMWADQGIVTPTKWTDMKYKLLSNGNEYLRISSEGWDGITDSWRNPTRDYYEVRNVYAHVYPLTSNISGTVASSLKKVTLPIHNDHDFISTRDYNIIYKVYVDERLTNQGTAQLDIAPHSDGALTIMTNIKKMSPDETAYVQLFFMKDGKEMSRKHVVIKEPESFCHISKQVKNQHDVASQLINSLRPTIWHKANEGDQICRSGLDCEQFVEKVLQINRKDTTDGFVLDKETLCVVNDSNSFRVSYHYTFNDMMGTIRVDYTISPDLTSSRYTMLAGIAIKASAEKWLGLGPDECFPNKKSYGLLGVYDARQLFGTRAAEWVTLRTAEGIPLKATFLNDGNIYDFGYHGYIDRDESAPDIVRLCSHILGRSEKGRLNDKIYRLEPKGQSFSGSILFSCVKKS